MILDNKIFTDNNRNIKVLQSICIKKGEIQPNNKIAKYGQIWWYKVECLECGYIYFVSRGKFISRKDNCPACSGKKTVVGINDLNTVRPDLIKYLKNKNDGKLFTQHSSKQILCKCPNCSNEKYISVHNLSEFGFHCDVCSDNISFPNKVFNAILQQLKIDFIAEYSPYWIGKKRYDFYLTNYNIIIEMDGKQHFEECKFMISLKKQNEIDRYKDFMALKNGIKVIRINCSESNIDFIKNELFKSELNNFLDLSKINWKQIKKSTMNNLMMIACELKNQNNSYTTSQIGKMLFVSQGTISRWLTKGNELGFCKYIPLDEMSKNGKRKHYNFDKVVEIYSINDEFLFEEPSIKDASNNSETKLGKYISRASISKCCNGHIKSCKGYKFKFKTL